MEIWERFWSDPVWSKVIAGAILAVLAVVWASIRGWWPRIGRIIARTIFWMQGRTSVANWLLIILLVCIVTLAGISSWVLYEVPQPMPIIEFTRIPPAGSGPDSQAVIEGQIKGLDGPANFKIVVYAFTDHWYVQPQYIQPYTEINQNGEWSTLTYLGVRYGALLVRSSYKPLAVTSILPAIGGEVVAKAEVKAAN